MSRSYRKHPVIADNAKYASFGKKQARRRVRNLDIEELPLKGNAEKKVYESWNIHDFKSYWSWENALKQYREDPDYYARYHHCYNEDDWYWHWYKCMKRK